jgi:hypothetical protein
VVGYNIHVRCVRASIDVDRDKTGTLLRRQLEQPSKPASRELGQSARRKKARHCMLRLACFLSSK